jgi:hypothetical protein
MLKSRIEMRTWADHDEDTPGFVEVDLVGHEGGNRNQSDRLVTWGVLVLVPGL